MGYSTDFFGSFDLDKPLDAETKALLEGINRTRRVKRCLGKLATMHNISLKEAEEKWGTEGEFFYDSSDFSNFGQTEDESVIDNNHPPSTQPGLWCQWTYNNRDGFHVIEWDGGEKFYEYIEWIKYLIDKILQPRGYILNGSVEWQGEEREDRGRILIEDNLVRIQEPVVEWSDVNDS